MSILKQFFFCVIILCYGCSSISDGKKKKISTEKIYPVISYDVKWRGFKITSSQPEKSISSELEAELAARAEEILLETSFKGHADLVIIKAKEGILFDEETAETFHFTGQCLIFNDKKSNELDNIEKNNKTDFHFKWGKLTITGLGLKISFINGEAIGFRDNEEKGALTL